MDETNNIHIALETLNMTEKKLCTQIIPVLPDELSW